MSEGLPEPMPPLNTKFHSFDCMIDKEVLDNQTSQGIIWPQIYGGRI